MRCRVGRFYPLRRPAELGMRRGRGGKAVAGMPALNFVHRARSGRLCGLLHILHAIRSATGHPPLAALATAVAQPRLPKLWTRLLPLGQCVQRRAVRAGVSGRIPMRREPRGLQLLQLSAIVPRTLPPSLAIVPRTRPPSLCSSMLPGMGALVPARARVRVGARLPGIDSFPSSVAPAVQVAAAAHSARPSCRS